MRGQVAHRRVDGFTLIELAVALFLLALLFGGIAIPMEHQVDLRKVRETERTLDRAREALLGYAAIRGYFPCPADDLSAGQEATGSNHNTGVCRAYHGYLPAALLGLGDTDAQGYAIDGWGTPANRIRYAVASDAVGVAANTNAFTRANGIRTAGVGTLGDPALSLFHVCSSGRGVTSTGCGNALTLVSSSPVVLWSSGANAATGGSSIDEAQNPNPNGGSADRIFVSRVRSAIAGNEFDDIVTWIPMPLLVNRMIAAGQLP